MHIRHLQYARLTTKYNIDIVVRLVVYLYK